MDYTIWPIVAGDDEYLDVVVDTFEPPRTFTWKCQIREGESVESTLWETVSCTQGVNNSGYMVVSMYLSAAQTRHLEQVIHGRCCVGFFALQMTDENNETHTVLKGELDMIQDVTL